MTQALYSPIFHSVSVFPFHACCDQLAHGRAADGMSLDNGWMQWSGGFIENVGDHADGQSLHITSHSGASVSLRFHGKVFIKP